MRKRTKRGRWVGCFVVYEVDEARSCSACMTARHVHWSCVGPRFGNHCGVGLGTTTVLSDQNPQAVVDILTCSAKHKVGVSLERGGAASLLKLVSDVIRLNNPLRVVWQSHVHIFISQNVEPLKASTYPDMSVFGIAQALPCWSLKDLLHAMRVSRY
jgi:hypothetical protein